MKHKEDNKSNVRHVCQMVYIVCYMDPILAEKKKCVYVFECLHSGMLLSSRVSLSHKHTHTLTLVVKALVKLS
ncbi:hypothetical protein EXN66_Car020841 [Channa argus]|uniref:Uncharacterized protein n=1 Tax=Channa argus TaxID=215402 RepID=A0A6G1QR01_CHAAH|nr:hypothetical protein EXN66_Car020841 [Channa argus]